MLNRNNLILLNFNNLRVFDIVIDGSIYFNDTIFPNDYWSLNLDLFELNLFNMLDNWLSYNLLFDYDFLLIDRNFNKAINLLSLYLNSRYYNITGHLDLFNSISEHWLLHLDNDLFDYFDCIGQLNWFLDYSWNFFDYFHFFLDRNYFLYDSINWFFLYDYVVLNSGSFLVFHSFNYLLDNLLHLNNLRHFNILLNNSIDEDLHWFGNFFHNLLNYNLFNKFFHNLWLFHNDYFLLWD